MSVQTSMFVLFSNHLVTSVEPASRTRLACYTGWWKLASTQSRRGGQRVPKPDTRELGFDADEGVAPEWLSGRSHDSRRQSNAAVDIGLIVAGVGDDGAHVGELVDKFDIIVADM